jgi:hypothetical protein
MSGKRSLDSIVFGIGIVCDEITRKYFGSRDVPRGLGRAKYINGEILHGTARTAARVEVHERSLVWEYHTCKRRVITNSLHQNSSVVAYKLLLTVSNLESFET